jgi:hypothetical protein
MCGIVRPQYFTKPLYYALCASGERNLLRPYEKRSCVKAFARRYKIALVWLR